MKQRFWLFIPAFMIICSFPLQAQTTKVKDYLSVPGPLSLAGTAYQLSWSSHSNEAYYKHEYLPANENPGRYKKMLQLELLFGNNTPAALAAAKVNELKQLQKTNPVVKYEIFQKNGEYMLDFLISDNAPNGDINIIEHNIYRYKSGKDKSGMRYVMLVGYSERAYGSESKDFMAALRMNKADLQKAVAGFAMPAITIK